MSLNSKKKKKSIYISAILYRETYNDLSYTTEQLGVKCLAQGPGSDSFAVLGF